MNTLNLNAPGMMLNEEPLGAGMRWHPVCRLDEVPVLGARVFDPAKATAGNVMQRIAIFRNARDQVFALDDRCPHKGGPLSQGMVFGDRVACPLHNWTIALGDGQAAAPDMGCAATHPLRVIEGQVFLALAGQDGCAL